MRFTDGTYQQQRASRGTWWRDNNPPFVLLGNGGVFQQYEAESIDGKRDGFVVVIDDDGVLCERLGHANCGPVWCMRMFTDGPVICGSEPSAGSVTRDTG